MEGMKMNTIIVNDQNISEGLLDSVTRQQAFGQVLDKYQQRIYFFIRYQLADHEETDELLQNMFLNLYRHVSSNKVNDHLHQLVYGFAAEACQLYFQKKPVSEWLPRLIHLLKQQELALQKFQ